MISFNLSNSINLLIKNSQFSGFSDELLQFIEESTNPLILELATQVKFWEELSVDPEHSSKINPQNITITVQSVSKYLNSKYPEDPEVDNMTARLNSLFCDSIKNFNDKKLIDLMRIFLNHFIQIAIRLESSASENSTLEDQQKIKEKIKNILLMFPGISATNSVDLTVCIEGHSNRIQEAFLTLNMLPIDQQICKDQFLQLTSDLVAKKFPRSIIAQGNHIHIEAFINSLFTLNHHQLDQFYKAPDHEVTIFDVLKIIREFKANINQRIRKLNQEIEADCDISVRIKANESGNVSSEAIYTYCKFLSEKYRINIEYTDLLKSSEDILEIDFENIGENSLINKDQLRSLVEQKLTEEFPQLKICSDDQSIPERIESSTAFNQSEIQPDPSAIASSEIQLDISQSRLSVIDPFDILEKTIIQKKIIKDNPLDQIDRSLDPKKINDILKLFLAKDSDPDKSQKIIAGIFLLHILARKFNGQDPVFFIILCEIIKEETSKDSFLEYFDYIDKQSLTDQELIGLKNILQYLDISLTNHSRILKELPEIIFLDPDNIQIDLAPYESKIVELYKEIYLQAYSISDYRIPESIKQKFDQFIFLHILTRSVKFCHQEIFTAILNQLPINEYDVVNTGNNVIKEKIFDTFLKQKNTHQLNLLHYAFIYNDKNIIEFLINYYNDDKEKFLTLLEEKDDQGITPLHHAFQEGHQDLVTDFFNKISSVEYESYKERLLSLLEIKDNQGLTPLHYAFQKGHQDLVTDFFNKISSVEYESYKERLLSLLEIKDNQGLTPLHHAFQKGHQDIVTDFFNKISSSAEDESYKEKLFKLLEIKDVQGLTPLHHAFQKGHQNVVEFFLNHLSSSNDKTYKEKLFKLLEINNNFKLNPLNYALKEGHKNIIEIFLNHLKSVKDKTYKAKLFNLLLQKTDNGENAVHLIFKAENSDNLRGFLSYLSKNKEYKETLFGLLKEEDNLAITPFEHACIKDRANNIEVFLKQISSFEKKDQKELFKLLKKNYQKKRTPLIWIFFHNSSNSLKVFLKYLINTDDKKVKEKLFKLLEKQYKNKYIPLHFLFCENISHNHAHDYNKTSTIQVFFKEISSVKNKEDKERLFKLLEKKDKLGNTLLHLATINGNHIIIEFFLKILSDSQEGKERLFKLLEQKDKQGNTPLHCAFKKIYNNPAMVFLENLSSSPEDKERLFKLLEQKDEQGNTPLHLLCINGNRDVLNSLFLHFHENNDQLIGLLKQKNNKGQTPLDSALILENKQILYYLSEKIELNGIVNFNLLVSYFKIRNVNNNLNNFYNLFGLDKEFLEPVLSRIDDDRKIELLFQSYNQSLFGISNIEQLLSKSSDGLIEDSVNNFQIILNSFKDDNKKLKFLNQLRFQSTYYQSFFGDNYKIHHRFLSEINRNILAIIKSNFTDKQSTANDQTISCFGDRQANLELQESLIKLIKKIAKVNPESIRDLIFNEQSAENNILYQALKSSNYYLFEQAFEILKTIPGIDKTRIDLIINSVINLPNHSLNQDSILTEDTRLTEDARLTEDTRLTEAETSTEGEISLAPRTQNQIQISIDEINLTADETQAENNTITIIDQALKNLFYTDQLQSEKPEKQIKKELKIIELLLKNITKIEDKTLELISQNTSHRNYPELELILKQQQHLDFKELPITSITSSVITRPSLKRFLSRQNSVLPLTDVSSPLTDVSSPLTGDRVKVSATLSLVESS